MLYATESATALPRVGVFDLMRQAAAVEAAPARFENRRDEHRVVDRRQAAAEIGRRRQASRESAATASTNASMLRYP